MSHFAFASATDLAARIRGGELGAEEALQGYLGRVERFNPALNAIVVRDFERALARAREADAARARGEVWGPLHGVPMTVKESFDVSGLPSTRGNPALRENVAKADAVAVERLRGAGAVIFGKTNVPFNLADFQSYNEIYGTTVNPWDHSRTPGGSSGGSAAALAAGLTGLEIGSDIGGSIRNPAHYCGVYGLKTTWGIAPMRGHSMPGVLTPGDISVIGPLARSAEDLALVLELIAGPEAIQAHGWRLALPPPPGRSLRDFRVALWSDDPFCPVAREVRAALDAAGRAAAAAGARVDDGARPAVDLAESHDVYNRLLRAETAARGPDTQFQKNLERSASLAPDDASEPAVRLRASVQYHREWHRANELRTRLRWAWRRFFDDWDVLLCPAACVPAFPHDHSRDLEARTVEIDGEVRPYWSQLFWAGLTGVAYLPATVAPIGTNVQGLPIGVQIVGPEGGDRATIELARLLGEALGGFRVPPDYAESP